MCDVSPNPAYESKSLQPQNDSYSSVDATNPDYEPVKISEEEGDDYVVMNSIRTLEKMLHEQKYINIASVA